MRLKTANPVGRARAAAALAVLAALAGCAGHASSAGARAGLGGRVDQVAGELADAGAHDVIVLVSTPGRTYTATHGADPTQRFRIGSVTKTFTATMVLQTGRRAEAPP